MAREAQNSETDREKEKRKFYPFWRYIGEVFLEPLVLAFAVFLFFSHIQELLATASNYSEFFRMLNEDVLSNMCAYILFAIIIIVWIIFRLKVKSWEFKERQDSKKRDDEMLETLRGIRELLRKDKLEGQSGEPRTTQQQR
jgi:large-conductance mechanosensitive channel